MNKLNIKKLNRRIKKSVLVAFSLFLALGPIISFAVPNKAEAKDASHQGMSYLSVKLNPSSHNVTAVVSGAATGNKVFGQDTIKSPEYKAEKIVWGVQSWKQTKSVLSGSFPSFPFAESNKGAWFNSSKAGSDYEDWLNKNKYTSSPSNNGQTSNLVMSFPGWGAGDVVPNLSSGKDKALDRNDSTTPGEFTDIDNNTASGAASAVNENLVGEFNRALDTFFSRVVDSETGASVTLNKEGMSNMVFLVASGYMPKDKKSVIKYDTVNSTFAMENLAKGKLEVVKNPWSRDKAGETLATYKSPGEAGTGDDQNYVYAVSKGYMSGVGKSSTKKYATDNYAITWMDLAIASTANAYLGEASSSSSSNDTVVGDQVNGIVYGALSGALSVLGVKTADELVFGTDGALFKNGTYAIYMALIAPFIVLALIILGYIGVDSLRKSNMQYLSKNQVTSIQTSVGRVFNALIMMAIMPLLVTLITLIDQALVGVAISLNAILSDVIGNAAIESAAGNGLLGNLGSAMTGGITNIVLAVLLCWVNVKFTWRYIARTISFGLYFLASPVIFALDALKGSGGIFEYGPMTADVWKNLTGLILQRSIDAFGIVVAINLGRVIFGQGMLISIVGYLSVEAITNAIMNSLGIRDSSVSGIADAGRKLQTNFNKGVGMAMGAVGVTAAASGMAAVKSGKNLDAQSYLNAKDKSKTTASVFDAFTGTGTGGTNTGIASATTTGTGSDFNAEGNKGFKTFKDRKGNEIGINEGGVRSTKSGLFKQGWTNSGVAYDKNSTKNPRGVTDDNKDFDPRHFKENAAGKIVANSDNLLDKERLYVGSRNLARFAGGAASTFKPGSAAKTFAGAALVGASQMTPTKWDNILGYSLLANNMENTVTGGNRKLSQALGSSMAARMIGLQASAFDFDEVTANGLSEKDKPFRGGSGGNVGKPSAPPGIISDFKYGDDGSVRSLTGITPEVKDKDAQQMLSSTSNFAREFGGPEFKSDSGIYNYNRDDIASRIFNPEDDTINNDAMNMLNHMDKNGYDKVGFDGSNLALEGNLEKTTTPMGDVAEGSQASFLANQAKDAPDNKIVDKVTGSIYSFDKGATDDKDTLSVFTPENKQENVRYNGEVQEATAKISKDKSLSRAEKGEKISEMYSKPNDYETARTTIDYLDNSKQATNKPNWSVIDTPNDENY